MGDINDKLIKQSSGTQPLPTTLSAQKNSGASTASLNAATGWDTTTAKHIRMYKTKVVNGATVPDTNYICYYKGTLSGTTLSNLTLVWSSTGSDQTFAIGDTVDLSYTSGWGEDLYSALSTHLDQDGTLKADAVDVTAVIKDAVITPAKLNSRTRLGWIDNELSAVSTVTHNGNRSYDVVFASTVASILSEGMRLEFTKVTAGNAYMGGAFNGSSHYFTKTSPLNGTLGTVTNNFTIEATYQPTAYQNATIAARADSAGNNTITLKMNATGQVELAVQNSGAANYRIVATYQSLPLNKKTHVAASWTSGTVVIYFDGVSVPVATATTAGTAPTTAGTGGDFSIGRKGASSSEYAPGYISNVGVFDAVLSASTIKDHYTKKLTGSETNCIGAWSLDNTANDQSSAGNNLTATGGVGYTAQSPHGQLGNGVETTKAVGLVTNVNGTTVTVQCPEGVTLPSGSSTISSVAYSTMANPFGWVSDKGRWIVGTYVGAQSQVTLTSNTTWYHLNQSLNVPIGKWMLGFQLAINYAHAGATYLGGLATLSNANNTESDKRFTYYCTPGSNVSTSSNNGQGNKVNDISLTSATTFYVNTKPTNNNSTATFDVSGMSLIFATPSCL